MKLRKTLFFLALFIIIIGLGVMVTGTVFYFIGKEKLGDLLLGISSVCGVAALAVLILRLIYAPDPNIPKPQPKIIVKTVDVKDIPKTREEELYEEYVKLHEQGLITKEQLDEKRIQLLGK